jgi:hypothetical protein
LPRQSSIDGSCEGAGQGVRRHLEIEQAAGVTVVRLIDRRLVDCQDIEELNDQLLALVEGNRHRMILLNLVDVEYLSNAALGKLVAF